MSNKDPFAEASKLLPGEDPDEINSAAFGATWRWREKIEPFQVVSFSFIERHMERLGKELTAHVDAEERARREARSKADLAESFALLDESIARLAARAERARQRQLIDAGAVPDDVATGW